MSDEPISDEDLGDYAPVVADHSARKAEIVAVMGTDITAYYRGGLDKEYTRLLREENGEIPAWVPMPSADSRALMVATDTGRALVEEWNAQGGFERVLQRVQGSVGVLVQGMGEDREQRAFMANFDRHIPEDVRYQVYSAIALGAWSFTPPATPDQVQVFRKGGPLGDALIAEWGSEAPDRIGQIFHRANKLREQIGDAGMNAFLGWFNSLNDRQTRRVLQFIAA